MSQKKFWSREKRILSEKKISWKKSWSDKNFDPKQIFGSKNGFILKITMDSCFDWTKNILSSKFLADFGWGCCSCCCEGGKTKLTPTPTPEVWTYLSVTMNSFW